MAAQEAELGVFFDTVVVCSVTGSTQAGMVAGFAQLEEQGARPRRVLGIDASAKPAETRDQVLRIAQRTAAPIGVERELTADDVELDERYHAGIYGIPDDATLDAMELAARTEGMITDPVYEGKSMAALDRPGRPPRDRPRRRPCSTPTSAASRRSTGTAPCSPDASPRSAQGGAEVPLRSRAERTDGRPVDLRGPFAQPDVRDPQPEGREHVGPALRRRRAERAVQDDVAGDRACPTLEAWKLSDVDHAPSRHGMLASPAWKKKPSRPMSVGVLAVGWTVKAALSQFSGFRICTGRYWRDAGSAEQLSKFGTRSGAAPPCTGWVPTTSGAVGTTESISPG